MKKILFGAGKLGKDALEFFGKEEVAFFVDNNKELVGTYVEGVEIISPLALMEIYKDYEIVICAGAAKAIAKQLEEQRIEKYTIYNIPQKVILNRLEQFLSANSVTSVLIYGIDDNTNHLLTVIKKYVKNKVDIKLSAEDLNEGRFCLPYEFIKCDEIGQMAKAECYIVGTINQHRAKAMYLKQLAPDGVKVFNPFKKVEYNVTSDVVVNPYVNSTKETTEEEWNSKVQTDIRIRETEELVQVAVQKVIPFEYIEIETINRCNGICSFCPVNQKIDPREKKIMSKELFEKIISELSEMKYSGELSLFSNNEPFLDDRIIELHKYAREKLPRARMHMFTNGTLLTLPKFFEIMKYLDEMVIDNYHQELKLIKPCREIVDYLREHPELHDKVTIVLRKPHEILTSRGGDAPNRNEKISFENAKCALPFQQMIVRPDGKVSLCCNDPLGKCTLGDLSKQSIMEVWYGEEYQKVRERISRGRQYYEHCRYCDTFYVY